MMHGSVQSIFFFVAVLKTVTGNVEVIYAEVGGEVTLRAPAHSSTNRYESWNYNDINFEIAWLNPFGGKKSDLKETWSTQLALADGLLVIKGVQEANFGTYFYKRNSELACTFKLLKLTVSGAPDTPLLAGDEISLNCMVDTPQGQNPPRIYWETPQGKKDSVSKIHVYSQDSGDWTCVVVNDKKEHRVKFSIIVVDFSPAPQVHYTSTTSRLNITFSIHPYKSWEKIIPRIKEVEFSFIPKPALHGNPQKLFSLSQEDLKNPRESPNKQLKPDIYPGGFSLSRLKGKEGDQGVYKCSVIFEKDRTLTSSMQVELLQIIPKPGVTLTYGERLEMACTTGEPLPSDLEAKWVSPKSSSQVIIDNSTNVLTVKEVSKEHRGIWRCELQRNSTQLTSAAIKMNIEPVLSAWMLVIICGAAAIIILLVVLTIILCRRKKRSGRHMRHRLCRCKNPKPKGFYRT